MFLRLLKQMCFPDFQKKNLRNLRNLLSLQKLRQEQQKLAVLRRLVVHNRRVERVLLQALRIVEAEGPFGAAVGVRESRTTRTAQVSVVDVGVAGDDLHQC